MSDLDDVRHDLLDEQHALDALVATVHDEQWALATASPGWTVADQIGHLAYFDEAARTAMLAPDTFNASIAALMEVAVERGLDEATLAVYRAMTGAQLLGAWREHRRGLAQAAKGLSDHDRVPWYGPSMGATSFLTARLMETWAHGTDVADALGARLPVTARLRHIARLGFITRAWSYRVRGETVPEAPVRVVLTSPDATATWTYGDDDATEFVRGAAEEFCLVVTQRRHIDDTALETSALGRHWMERAQAFAGGPTLGPAPKG